MKKPFNQLGLAACLTVLFANVGRSCLGQGTIYFDRSNFEFAIAGLTGIRRDVDFQPPFPPGGIDDGVGVRYSLPLTMSGITFPGGGPLYIRFVGGGGNLVLNNYDSLSPLVVDMNGPALAFGADFASLLTPVYTSFLATVTLNDGRVFTFTAPANPNFTFFGFVTAQPFSTLTFSDGGLIGLSPPLHEEILDNITVVQVPEPSMWALLALGALLLSRRWRRFSAPR
jgi:hypothetical protein